MTNADALLHELDARLQIHDVLMRACRGVDRLDRNMMIAGYHPDAIDRHGSFEGSREEFADWVIGRHRGMILSCMHLIGNEYIEVSGDTARCESYVVCYYRMKDGDGLVDFTAPGRYLDTFEKRDGKWKILDRQVVFEKDRIDPVDRISEGPLTEMLVKGRRDRQDPAYAFFQRA